MELGITTLGSGSKGNAFLVHNKDEAILVDAGFSRKELIARIKQSGFEPEMVKAIIVTHEHIDHIKGVRVFADTYKLKTYASIDTAKYLEAHQKINDDFVMFDAGTAFDIGDFRVQPFSIPHDAIEPVGFVVHTGSKKIGIAIDLGHVTRLVSQRLHDCDALIYECNHDINMLRNSTRPLHLKRRILGRHGHLNNDDALTALDEIITEKTKSLILSHLSEECNCSELVQKIGQQKLAEMERTDILLRVAQQNEPLSTIWI